MSRNLGDVQSTVWAKWAASLGEKRFPTDFSSFRLHGAPAFLFPQVHHRHPSHTWNLFRRASGHDAMQRGGDLRDRFTCTASATIPPPTHLAQNSLQASNRTATNLSVFSPDPSTSTSTLVRRQTTSRSSTRTSSLSPSSTESVSSPASTDLNGQPPVLRINYPAESYSKRTGGTQFYAAPLNSTSSGEGQVDGNSTTNGQYERMMLSYDVWFPVGFA